MRNIFATALLAVGAFADNTKTVDFGSLNLSSTDYGNVSMSYNWVKTGGKDNVVEKKYTLTFTRTQAYKDLATANKFTIYWPNAAGTSAEIQVIKIPNTAAAWNYLYGS